MFVLTSNVVTSGYPRTDAGDLRCLLTRGRGLVGGDTSWEDGACADNRSVTRIRILADPKILSVIVNVETVFSQTLHLRVHLASGDYGGGRDSEEKMKLIDV